ncbi:MAG: hypothetical protein KGY38_01630 [Desulfobacterales bacterium]|nr:hypothetical protein [Desulfobacterales bacterium]
MARLKPDIKPLVDFFLNLFVIQTIGPGKETEIAEAALVSENSSKTSVYEFKIKSGQTKKHRRMSVQPIGEQVGSKSVCYMVVYDEPLVVKVPPKPINEFSTYLEYIHREHRTADRLCTEISCVFPRLEAILKKVPFLRLPEEMTPEEAEEAYIKQLLRKPGLQQYLKIGGSFVFFMNLSRHQFFNQVVQSMHRSKDRVRSDILKNMPEAFADPDAFESLYGEENYQVYLELRQLFAEYEKIVDNLTEKYGKDLFLPEYRSREWFFSFLTGISPEIEPEYYPEEFPGKLTRLAAGLMKTYKQTVNRIYRTVHTRVQRENFETNRSRMKGMIINLLELLYQLKIRNLAIRDLKPDNMYIDKHLDAADHILADPGLYNFGLIDLETAVCFDPEETLQPLLAGTPAYATPSHLFPNKILKALYPRQLDRVFYMQDWYAAVGIIFNVITGRVLFAKTARLMPEIIRAKRHAVKNAENYKEIYKNISARFWRTAIEEFKEKTVLYRHRFEALDIILPFHLKELIKKEAERENQLLQDTISNIADNSKALDRYREPLLNAPYEQIVKNIESQRAGQRSQTGLTVRVLEKIAGCKYRQAHINNAVKNLSGPVSSGFMLYFIFDRVFYAMHKQQWSRSQPGLTGPCIERYRDFQSRT